MMTITKGALLALLLRYSLIILLAALVALFAWYAYSFAKCVYDATRVRKKQKKIACTHPCECPLREPSAPHCPYHGNQSRIL